jgi:hypothetical protein
MSLTRVRYHASVAPASPREHLKLAFFFRPKPSGKDKWKAGSPGAKQGLYNYKK